MELEKHEITNKMNKLQDTPGRTMIWRCSAWDVFETTDPIFPLETVIHAVRSYGDELPKVFQREWRHSNVPEHLREYAGTQCAFSP